MVIRQQRKNRLFQTLLRDIGECLREKLRRTQNTEIARQIMGHKRLDTTQKYLHLLAGTGGEWIVEGTTDKEHAKQLLASDFTYQLTTPDGTMLFRKAK